MSFDQPGGSGSGTGDQGTPAPQPPRSYPPPPTPQVIVQQRRGCSAGTVILVGLVIVLAIALVSTLGTMGVLGVLRGGISSPSGDKVAIINISGLISWSAGGGVMGASEGVGPVLDHLRDAEQDDSVKSILLWVDSPGGSAAASQAVYQKLMEVRQKKPIVAGMADVAASGAYYISCAANKIVAQRATETGSIGVIFHTINLAGLLSKYGVSEDVVKSGVYKDMGSPYRPMTSAEQSIMKGMIMNIYDQFVSDVASARNMPVQKVKSLADGRVWTGQQALKLGLIDQLGTREDAIKLAAKLGGIQGWPKFKQYQELPVWMKMLAGSTAAAGKYPWYMQVLENPGPWLTLPVPAIGLLSYPAMRP